VTNSKLKPAKPDVDYNSAGYEIASLFHGQLLSYMVGFYIFAFYLELHNRFPILQAIRFQFTYGAIIGAMCLYKFLNDQTKQASFNSVTKTTFLLIFIMGIYTIFSMDRPESMTVYNDRVIKFALVSFFIYAATDKIADLRVILGFMLLAWLKIGQEGFLGWSTGSLMWENQGIQRLHGSTAMYGHPNSFSGFAVGCLPYTVFLLMCVKSNLLRLGLLAIIICSLIIVVNTGSRTGYVAVVVGAAYFFFTLKTGKMKVILLASLTVMMTINLVPQQYKERFESIFTGHEKEGRSSEKRIEIIEDAIAVTLRYPLGIGLQAFPKVRNEMFSRSQNTHSLYLEVLTNIGPIGFIVFSIFIIKLLALNKALIRRLALSKLPDNEKHFLVNLCKGTIGFILIRLLLGLFGMDLYEIYWWIALGFSLATVKIIYRNEKSNPY